MYNMKIKKIFISFLASIMIFTVTVNDFIIPVEAVTTITITKANDSTAKKLNSALNKGKTIYLKVKGNKTSSKKLLSSLNTKIKKINKQGVVFKYSGGKKSGKYYKYTISSSNANYYKYSVKFVNKIYSNVKNTIKKKIGYKDYLKYPNATERHLKELYDTIIDYYFYTEEETFTTNDGEIYKYKFVESDNISTKLRVNSLPDYGTKDYENMMNYMIKSQEETFVGPLNDRLHYTKTFLKTFNEFKSENPTYIKNLLKKATFRLEEDITSQDQIILKKSYFCDLNSAMKIYAIAYSDYFECNSNGKYSMKYKAKTAGLSRKYSYGTMMKKLYNNTASGVCEDYARYEICLFKALGITCYFNSSYKINHAWSVVKVTNSAKKTLWIPFDYGIGPSNYSIHFVTGESSFLVLNSNQKKYINTEAKAFKLYLSGIKGAPKKRNYSLSDFK